ncbi:universal stress protein [Leptothoe spongobia]|uniref:Universal stress protein n=1 Tax=Leptothoe spongobia TAU-MAC 1115 TaxID=1967444 RepID=A0A947DEC4_9CYAN|nr:universal stress protein [Leptothoe spongobia]MBT9315467.1 universal stress protein [Leptothoe spongobia TAU-MAC 1115]
MFKCALVCTDFEDSLQRLIKFVPDLVQSGLEQVVFFHNVSLTTDREIPKVDDEAVANAKQRLAAASHAVLPDGKSVVIDVRSGRVIDNISKVARCYDADVLILGTPTRSLLTEKLFGSTTTGIANQLDIPLVILRPQLIATYREQELALRCQTLFTHLLLPYDGSNSAKYLVSQVKAVAQSSECPQHCTLCWIIDDCIRVELRESEKQVQSQLDQVKADLETAGVEVFTEIRQGDPQSEILKSAEVNDISAIAICSGKSKGILKWSVPSFTSALLRSSWHPVIHFPRAS